MNSAAFSRSRRCSAISPLASVHTCTGPGTTPRLVSTRAAPQCQHRRKTTSAARGTPTINQSSRIWARGFSPAPRFTRGTNQFNPSTSSNLRRRTYSGAAIAGATVTVGCEAWEPVSPGSTDGLMGTAATALRFIGNLLRRRNGLASGIRRASLQDVSGLETDGKLGEIGVGRSAVVLDTVDELGGRRPE